MVFDNETGKAVMIIDREGKKMTKTFIMYAKKKGPKGATNRSPNSRIPRTPAPST